MPKFGEQSSFRQIRQFLLPPIFPLYGNTISTLTFAKKQGGKGLLCLNTSYVPDNM